MPTTHSDGGVQNMEPEDPGSDEVEDIGARLLARLGTIGLEDRLRATAAESCRRALAAVGDWVEAVYQGGQALEHLAKAEIFADDPKALTNANKAASVAFLTGKGDRAVRHLGQVYTISGRKAVVDAFTRLGLSLDDPTDLDSGFDARNAAAHLGFADNFSAPGALGGFMRLINQLLAARGVRLGDWLEDEDLAQIAHLLSQLPQGEDSFVGSLEARVLAQIWNAKQEVHRLRQRLPEEAWLSLATSPRDPTWSEDRVLRPCPTGGHLAWFALEWEESDTQDNDDPDELRDEVAYVGGLDCGLCGLDLDGQEVAVIGLTEAVDWRTVER